MFDAWDSYSVNSFRPSGAFDLYSVEYSRMMQGLSLNEIQRSFILIAWSCRMRCLCSFFRSLVSCVSCHRPSSSLSLRFSEWVSGWGCLCEKRHLSNWDNNDYFFKKIKKLQFTVARTKGYCYTDCTYCSSLLAGILVDVILHDFTVGMICYRIQNDTS